MLSPFDTFWSPIRLSASLPYPAPWPDLKAPQASAQLGSLGSGQQTANKPAHTLDEQLFLRPLVFLPLAETPAAGNFSIQGPQLLIQPDSCPKKTVKLASLKPIHQQFHWPHVLQLVWSYWRTVGNVSNEGPTAPSRPGSFKQTAGKTSNPEPFPRPLVCLPLAETPAAGNLSIQGPQLLIQPDSCPKKTVKLASPKPIHQQFHWPLVLQLVWSYWRTVGNVSNEGPKPPSQPGSFKQTAGKTFHPEPFPRPLVCLPLAETPAAGNPSIQGPQLLIQPDSCPKKTVKLASPKPIHQQFRWPHILQLVWCYWRTVGNVSNEGPKPPGQPGSFKQTAGKTFHPEPFPRPLVFLPLAETPAAGNLSIQGPQLLIQPDSCPKKTVKLASPKPIHQQFHWPLVLQLVWSYWRTVGNVSNEGPKPPGQPGSFEQTAGKTFHPEPFPRPLVFLPLAETPAAGNLSIQGPQLLIQPDSCPKKTVKLASPKPIHQQFHWPLVLQLVWSSWRTVGNVSNEGPEPPSQPGSFKQTAGKTFHPEPFPRPLVFLPLAETPAAGNLSIQGPQLLIQPDSCPKKTVKLASLKPIHQQFRWPHILQLVWSYWRTVGNVSNEGPKPPGQPGSFEQTAGKTFHPEPFPRPLVFLPLAETPAAGNLSIQGPQLLIQPDSCPKKTVKLASLKPIHQQFRWPHILQLVWCYWRAVGNVSNEGPTAPSQPGSFKQTAGKTSNPEPFPRPLVCLPLAETPAAGNLSIQGPQLLIQPDSCPKKTVKLASPKPIHQQFRWPHILQLVWCYWRTVGNVSNESPKPPGQPGSFKQTAGKTFHPEPFPRPLVFLPPAETPAAGNLSIQGPQLLIQPDSTGSCLKKMVKPAAHRPSHQRFHWSHFLQLVWRYRRTVGTVSNESSKPPSPSGSFKKMASKTFHPQPFPEPLIFLPPAEDSAAGNLSTQGPQLLTQPDSGLKKTLKPAAHRLSHKQFHWSHILQLVCSYWQTAKNVFGRGLQLIA